ncbi:MAG: hypothetical protein DRG25_05955, partial [Deltaproteobacteria bacterium]
GQIVINLKGREPQGIVNPGSEFSGLQKELVEKLRHLKDPETGEVIKSDIYLKEECFKGKYLEEMADITYLPVNYNYVATSVIGFFTNKIFIKHNSYRSTHDMNGVFIAWGRHFKKNHWLKGAELIDIAPTLLYLLGLKIPTDMDGKVLTDIFQEDFIKKNKTEFYDRAPSKVEEYQPQISEEDDREIRKRLKELGYID